MEKLRLNDFVLKSEKDQNGEVKQYYVNETHTSARANVKIFFRGIMKVKVCKVHLDFYDFIQRKYQIRLPFDGTNTCPGASFELYRSKINSKIRYNPETLLLLRVY